MTLEVEGRAESQDLRLGIVDAEDLAVVSAHLQDADVAVADMAYLPRMRRFALVAARFDWCKAATGHFERCRTGLHFDGVLSVARTGLSTEDSARTLQLLAISFVPGPSPGGTVLLTFFGGARIRLEVECLEAQMRDIGPRWSVGGHPGDVAGDPA